MKLNPVRQNNGGFIVKFRHPILKKPVSYGLGTQDETVAHEICNDAVRLLENPNLKDTDLTGYSAKAVQIAYGDQKASEFKDTSLALQKPLSTEDVQEIKKRVKLVEDWQTILQTSGAEDVDNFKELGLQKLLVDFNPKNHSLLLGLAKSQGRKIAEMQDEIKSLKIELQKFRQINNAHADVTILQAFEAFKKVYNGADRTKKENYRWIEHFIESLQDKGSTKISTVFKSDVKKWLEAMGKLSEQTLKNRRNSVSTFFSDAINRYELFSNPVSGLKTNGTKRDKSIIAIDRISELQSLIKSLEGNLYWQCWVALACLMGPRWKEQATIKIQDVLLGTEGNQVKLIGKKTRHNRLAKIEKTTLLPILTKFLELRVKQQKSSNVSPEEKSDYLFYSLAKRNPKKDSKLCGLWRSSNSWWLKWAKCVSEYGSNEAKLVASAYISTRKDDLRQMKEQRSKGLKVKTSKVPKWTTTDQWNFGPREWRHTAGTAMANCGLTAIDISRQLGNSAVVAENHYISRTSQDKVWPFKW